MGEAEAGNQDDEKVNSRPDPKNEKKNESEKSEEKRRLRNKQTLPLIQNNG